MPKVSQPVGGSTSTGLHAGSPGPSAPDGSCGPRLGPAQGQPRKPGRKSPRPGVAAAFRPARRLGPGPGRCEARASTAAPDPPTCRGPHNWQPHPLPGPGARPASTAASSGGSARRGVRQTRGRRSYLRWALSSRRGNPRPPRACRRRGRGRAAARPPLSLFTTLRGRTPTDLSRDAHVTCSTGVGQRRCPATTALWGRAAASARSFCSPTSWAAVQSRQPARPDQPGRGREKTHHRLRPLVTPEPNRMYHSCFGRGREFGPAL